MRNTFLVFNDPTNPGAGLRVAKPQEWDQILKKNKTLPREQRRFFITDAFEDCGEIDCMYIETTQEEYNKWHSQKVESERKRKLGEEYGKISFEQQAPGTEFLFSDIIGDGFDLEKAVHDISGYIVFTQDSFTEAYSEEQRTYAVSSNNKAFIEGMGGYSIYASSLDGSDPCVRLEAYMADEHGGKDGWKIERCYMKDPESREMVDIIFGQFFVCYAPAESEKFLSLPKELAQKYEARFKFPERFFKQGNEIKAVPYKPKTRGQER